MKQQINALPAPTFRWLKMNGTLLEKEVLPQEEERFTVSEGAEESLILIDDGKRESLSVRYKLTLEKNAVLNLIQVITNAGDQTVVQQTEAVCGENALLHVFWIFTGGKATYPSIQADLTGDGSRLEMDAAYVVRPGELLDMNVVSNHFGRNTDTRIAVRGVLYEKAKKIFRGTIDFRKGCKGATGDEREEVLLMDDEAVNQTVPLILCAEEDVAGNHGASIGRIDEDEQFYMLARGLSGDEIEQILLRARINAVIAKMPDQVRCTVGKTMGLMQNKEEECRP